MLTICIGDNLEWFGLVFLQNLGFHPLTKAVLIAISTSPPKWPPIGPQGLKILKNCKLLVGLGCLDGLEAM